MLKPEIKKLLPWNLVISLLFAVTMFVSTILFRLPFRILVGFNADKTGPLVAFLFGSFQIFISWLIIYWTVTIVVFSLVKGFNIIISKHDEWNMVRKMPVKVLSIGILFSTIMGIVTTIFPTLYAAPFLFDRVSSQVTYLNYWFQVFLTWSVIYFIVVILVFGVKKVYDLYKHFNA